MSSRLGQSALSPLNGHEVVNVYWPPDDTSGEPVGYVYAHRDVGGVVIKASFRNFNFPDKLVSDFWPFLERRVDRAIRRKVGHVAAQASLIFEQPSQADLLA